MHVIIVACPHPLAVLLHIYCLSCKYTALIPCVAAYIYYTCFSTFWHILQHFSRLITEIDNILFPQTWLALFCICLSNTVLSQQCYNQPNCTEDVVPGPTTAEECCVGTDDGMSFGYSGGTCTVSQCIGNWNMFIDMYTKYYNSVCIFTSNEWCYFNPKHRRRSRSSYSGFGRTTYDIQYWRAGASQTKSFQWADFGNVLCRFQFYILTDTQLYRSHSQPMLSISTVSRCSLHTCVWIFSEHA